MFLQKTPQKTKMIFNTISWLDYVLAPLFFLGKKIKTVYI